MSNEQHEWTVERSETSGWYVAFTKNKGVFIDNELTARAIARYHNTVLGQERQKWQLAMKEWQYSLKVKQKQLAAERLKSR